MHIYHTIIDDLYINGNKCETQQKKNSAIDFQSMGACCFVSGKQILGVIY
jgi:hypothetical protein